MDRRNDCGSPFYWFLTWGATDFDLDSINLGKHILNRQKLESGRANISELA
jgi:hypothetical protein